MPPLHDFPFFLLQFVVAIDSDYKIMEVAAI